MTEMEFEKTYLDGCSLEYDHKVGAGYLHTRPNPDSFATAKTYDLGEGVLVDVDAAGQVRGIENYAGRVDERVLLKVIRWLDVVRGRA